MKKIVTLEIKQAMDIAADGQEDLNISEVEQLVNEGYNLYLKHGNENIHLKLISEREIEAYGTFCIYNLITGGEDL